MWGPDSNPIWAQCGVYTGLPTCARPYRTHIGPIRSSHILYGLAICVHWCHPARTFMRNYQGKSEADCSHNAEKGKSYFPYITISLLLKLIRDKSYVPYSIVILLLKAQKIDVSDALHIYMSYVHVAKHGQCLQSFNGGLPISRVAPLDQLLPLSLGSSG